MLALRVCLGCCSFVFSNPFAYFFVTFELLVLLFLWTDLSHFVVNIWNELILLCCCWIWCTVILAFICTHTKPKDFLQKEIRFDMITQLRMLKFFVSKKNSETRAWTSRYTCLHFDLFFRMLPVEILKMGAHQE